MIHEGVPHRFALTWCLKSGVLKAQKFGGCQGGSRFATAERNTVHTD